MLNALPDCVLQTDVQYFARVENQSMEAQLINLFDQDIDACIKDPSGHSMNAAMSQVKRLCAAIAEMKRTCQLYVFEATKHCERITNSVTVSSESQLRFQLGQLCRQEALIEFELLVGLVMCTTAAEDLHSMNPCLGPELVQLSQNLTIAIILQVNRLGHLIRCELLALDLQRTLQKIIKDHHNHNKLEKGDDWELSAQKVFRVSSQS